MTLILGWSALLGSVVAVLWKRYDGLQTQHYNDMRAECDNARTAIQADRDWLWQKFWESQDQGDKRLDTMQAGIAALQTALTAVQTSQETVLAILRHEQQAHS